MEKKNFFISSLRRTISVFIFTFLIPARLINLFSKAISFLILIFLTISTYSLVLYLALMKFPFLKEIPRIAWPILKVILFPSLMIVSKAISLIATAIFNFYIFYFLILPIVIIMVGKKILKKRSQKKEEKDLVTENSKNK